MNQAIDILQFGASLGMPAVRHCRWHRGLASWVILGWDEHVPAPSHDSLHRSLGATILGNGPIRVLSVVGFPFCLAGLELTAGNGMDRKRKTASRNEQPSCPWPEGEGIEVDEQRIETPTKMQASTACTTLECRQATGGCGGLNGTQWVFSGFWPNSAALSCQVAALPASSELLCLVVENQAQRTAPPPPPACSPSIAMVPRSHGCSRFYDAVSRPERGNLAARLQRSGSHSVGHVWRASGRARRWILDS